MEEFLYTVVQINSVYSDSARLLRYSELKGRSR